MSLTANSDVMGRFHESAFNKILEEVMLQRPSIFNYATEKVGRNNRFCTPIRMNPILEAMGVDKYTKLDKLPILGGSDDGVLDFCAQLKELKIDFNPSSEIQLPTELGSLAVQQFALKGTLCAGLGCSHLRLDKVDDLGIVKVVKKPAIRKITSGLSFVPLTYLNMNCFCLSLYCKVILIRRDNYLQLKVSGIELEDISPLGLENSIECYLKSMLDTVVFPKLKLAIEDLSFDIGGQLNVNISLTPTSAVLPYNPDVSSNYLSTYLTIQ